jgi:heptosyltransferase III
MEPNRLNPELQTMNSILVIRGGAIGDLIVTLPVLAALKQRYPQAKIELLANPATASLAVEFSVADKVRDLGSLFLAPLFAPNGNPSDESKSWLAGFDVIVSYLHDPNNVFEMNVRRFFPAKYIAGPHRPDNNASIHATSQLLKPLHESLDIHFDVQSSMFNVQRCFSNLVAIHPGSGSPLKNWPEANWRSLLEDLVAQTNLNFLLIGGEAERERIPALAPLIPSHRLTLAVDLPLVELASRLKTARTFIGHDSGITHLAALLGLECIVLWGPTNEHVWRPMGERVHVLRDPRGLNGLPVKIVINTLNSLLATP